MQVVQEAMSVSTVGNLNVNVEAIAARDLFIRFGVVEPSRRAGPDNVCGYRQTRNQNTK